MVNKKIKKYSKLCFVAMKTAYRYKKYYWSVYLTEIILSYGYEARVHIINNHNDAIIMLQRRSVSKVKY